tara:strand:- start:9299 stop:9544 length:246 start_codon:yes stop_codon:yes gene_type:complete
MAKIKVNNIVNFNDDGAPELTQGATIPSGYTLDVNGDVNATGVVTASNFVGDGSNLTQLNIATESKSFAFKTLFLDPPFRA